MILTIVQSVQFLNMVLLIPRRAQLNLHKMKRIHNKKMNLVIIYLIVRIHLDKDFSKITLWAEASKLQQQKLRQKNPLCVLLLLSIKKLNRSNNNSSEAWCPNLINFLELKKKSLTRREARQKKIDFSTCSHLKFNQGEIEIKVSSWATTPIKSQTQIFSSTISKKRRMSQKLRSNSGQSIKKWKSSIKKSSAKSGAKAWTCHHLFFLLPWVLTLYLKVLL